MATQCKCFADGPMPAHSLTVLRCYPCQASNMLIKGKSTQNWHLRFTVPGHHFVQDSNFPFALNSHFKPEQHVSGLKTVKTTAIQSVAHRQQQGTY